MICTHYVLGSAKNQRLLLTKRPEKICLEAIAHLPLPPLSAERSLTKKLQSDHLVVSGQTMDEDSE